MPPSRLLLTREVRHRLIAHSERALPLEAVGILGGASDGRVQGCYPLPNIAPPGAFLADPYAQYRALAELRGRGLVALAVYHSHPGGGAGLSEADRTMATANGLAQVVVALARPHRPGAEIRGFRVVDGVAREIELVTVDG